ncbi:MAG: response regulator, partial [Pseudomonadota bacterium]
FEPFYSTKDDAGTGLGLTTVMGIVEQHRGRIWFRSSVDEGTTFTICLPATLTESPTESHRAKPGALQGNEVIVLVEDDRQVRDLARQILEAHGYRVLSAADGEEALQVIASYGQDVDLVITDVVMPGLSGSELHEQLSEKYPGLAVLFMSGYADDVIAHRGVLDSNTPFIAKPFSVIDLLEMVRSSLDKPDRAKG